jgi:hypothetical protein
LLAIEQSNLMVVNAVANYIAGGKMFEIIVARRFCEMWRSGCGCHRPGSHWNQGTTAGKSRISGSANFFDHTGIAN